MRAASPRSGTRPLVDGDVLHIDDLILTVRISPRRLRLGITVERDARLTLYGPTGCLAETAEEFVRQHRAWILGKLRLWERNVGKHPTKRLLDGEGFLYLGRSYRLLLIDDPRKVVSLDGTRLVMPREMATPPSRARQELLRWYRQRGREWSHGRSQPWAARLGVSAAQVVVRDLGNRWGSYHPASGPDPKVGRVYLNWTTFQLPPYLIDYVVAHELAHAIIPHHGRKFWRLLGQAMTDCETRKTQLDDLGRSLWMGDLVE
jgi:predicted metal-dependent hydrolase